jgi:hypothetical protein
MMKKQRITIKEILILLAVVLLGLFLVAGLVGVNYWAAGRYGQGENFLPAWNGARAFLFENLDPYTRTIAERTQAVVYGRIAAQGEYPFYLDIPFPLLVFFIPFAFIPDPEWARTVWMTLSEIGLMLLCIIALRLADWRPERRFLVFALAFSLTWLYSLIYILEGSFSAVLILALMAALLAMRGFRDELAGFLLAISAMKWETTILLWIIIIIGAYSTKRWRVFYGMGMTWFVLGAIGFLIYPDWFWPFLRSVAGNWRAGEFLTFNSAMIGWIPGFGKAISLLIIALLLLLLMIDWYASLRSRDFRRVAWAAALAIAITPIIGLPVVSSNIVTLLFPIFFILPFVWERWEKRSYLAAVILGFFFYTVPLLFGWLKVTDRLNLKGMDLFVPSMICIISLYWIRWTLIRPPRTWLDGVKRELNK